MIKRNEGGLDVDGLSAFVSVGIGMTITRFTTLFPNSLVDVTQLGAPITWIILVILAGLKERTVCIVDVGFAR